MQNARARRRRENRVKSLFFSFAHEALTGFFTLRAGLAVVRKAGVDEALYAVATFSHYCEDVQEGLKAFTVSCGRL